MTFIAGIGWFRSGTHGELAGVKQLVNRVGDPMKGSFSFLNESHLMGSWAFRNLGPIMASVRLRNQLNITMMNSWQLVNTLVEVKLGSWQILNKLEEFPILMSSLQMRNNILGLASTSLEWGDFDGVADAGPGAATGDYDILIDGVSVKGQVLRCNITLDEGQFTNTCEINLADVNLWPDVEPDLSGDLRIEVKIGTVQYFFMLEERGIDVNVAVDTVNIWGRSKTALLDAPYSAPLDTELDATKLASEIVDDLAPGFTTDWQILDYFVVPGAIEQLGKTPVQVIAELAAGSGGLVRCSPEGDLIIRYKHPEDLVAFEGETPSYFFTDYDNVVTMDEQFDLKQLANAVLIEEQTAAGVGLSGRIEVDRDLSPTVLAGVAFHLRVYLNDTPDHDQFPSWPGGFYSLDLSQGAAVFVGTIEREEEEIISILRGAGSVGFPIVSITSLDWQTEDLGSLTFTPGDEEVVLASEADENGLVKVTYQTVYDSWRIDPPLTKEAVLIAALKEDAA